MSYLIGSIPLSVWLGRIFRGIDLRDYGSKGTGATNTFRVLGPEIGVVVLIFDIIKGISLPLLLSLFNFEFTRVEILLMGIYAVLGHVYPLFSGLKGGKGVATVFGLLGILYPTAALLSLTTFLIVLFRTNYVSLSSIIASFFVPLSFSLFYSPISLIEIYFAISVPLMVTFTHRKNILRLIRKDEPKIRLEK